MMRSHVGAVVVAIGVEAITEVAPISGAEQFMAVVTVLPVGDTRDAAMDTGRPVARAAGAAAIGAAAVGAYGYYGGSNNRCYQDGYGNTVCPQQYPY